VDKTKIISDGTGVRVVSKTLLLLLFRIVRGASVTQRAFASDRNVRVLKLRIKQFGFGDPRAQFPALNIG
jgi:hypothetical protein